MTNRFINPKTLAKPPGYTYVVETTGPGRTVYLAGQLGLDLDNKLVGGPGDFRAQCAKAFENLGFALAAVGATFDDVVKINNYLVDMCAYRHFPRGARHLPQHQGAAGLHHGGDLGAGAAGRAVRDRGDRGVAAESGGQAGGGARAAQTKGQGQGEPTKTKVIIANTGSSTAPDQSM